MVIAVVLVVSQHKEHLPAAAAGTPQKKTFKKERRIYPRYQTSLRAKYKTPAGEGMSWVKDISRSGVRLFLNQFFEKGSLLELEISLPYDSKPVPAKAHVVWMNKDESDAGLSFSDVKQDDINRIFQHIGHREQIRLAQT